MLIIMCAMAILLNILFVISFCLKAYQSIEEDDIFNLGTNLLFVIMSLTISVIMLNTSYEVYKNYDEIKVLIEE